MLGSRRAYGVATFADGISGTGWSVNEASGTIRTEGREARGLYASACVWTGEECDPAGRGTAIAINRGSVTTMGERAPGVRAGGNGIGTTARAVNDTGGTIRTEGSRAAGLVASADGATARAQAENRGSITTTGFRANGIDAWSNSAAAPVSAEAENWGSVATTGDRSYAISVYSDRSGASAVNHEGGSVTTSGAGSRGLIVSTDGTDQTASAVNHGFVTTTGGGFSEADGSGSREAHAVVAFANGISGSSRATNEATGTIRTEGDGARGIVADACAWTGTECDPNGSATSIAINRGSITTTGERHTRPDGGVRRPYAVRAGANGAGRAQAINEGTARTEGENTHALTASLDNGRGGQARVENRASGYAETAGDNGAFGIFGWIGAGSTDSSLEITNEGSVITRGLDSDGMLAVAGNGGTQAAPNTVRAVNLAGGTVETEGDGSAGVGAHIAAGGTAPITAYGSARAENHGTIVTAGGTDDPSEAMVARRILSAANGLTASFFTFGDEADIANAGDVTVVNSGTVTVTGESAGLSVRTFGTGSATVEMTGGSVTAGMMDDSATPQDESGFGIGIYAVAHTDSSSDDTDDDTDVSITVSGPTTTVTAHGGADDDPTTDTLDESQGIGILAQTGATGHIEVEISGGATITADRAAVFEGGRTTFNLVDSTIFGDIEFASLDDHMTVRNGLVDGDVHFGDGTDTLVLDVPDSGGITGRITGLEELLKRGAGVARIFDAELSDNALAVEEGELSVSGHLNLGSQGTLTVHDSARLSVEVGDLTADAEDHGLITAGQGVIYEGIEENEAPELFLQLASNAAANADAIQAVLEESPIDVLGEDTRVKIQTDAGPVDAGETRLSTTDADGSAREIGSVQEDGEVSLAADATLGEPPPVDERPRSGGGGGNAGVILLGGGALIAAVLMDSLGEDEIALADWETAASDRRTTTSFAGIRSGNAIEHRVRSGGLEHWTRTFAGNAPTLAGGAAGTLRGIATGLDAKLAGGFHLGVTAMPELSMSSGPGPASEYDSSLNGSHYSFRGGWRGAYLFTDATLSQGRYRAQSLFDNPASGGVLGGEFGLAQRQVHGRAGAQLGFGSLQATPSLSLFSGSLRQDAHTAESAALRAEVPGVSQHYQGWKAALNLAPSGWLEGPRTSRWRPGLHLASMRTRTRGSSMVDVRQSDKAGVLSFSSRARARALPQTVHSFGASVTALRSESWRLRMGYAGIVVDDEPIHAAVARLHVRF